MKFLGMGAAALLISTSVAQAAITDDPKIQSAMLTSEGAARVIVGCPSIGMNANAMSALVEELTTHVNSQGYSANEAGLIQSEAFRSQISNSIDQFITNEGFDPKTEEGLCGFGASEIAKGSKIGQMLN